jgi:hypothetical protein
MPDLAPGEGLHIFTGVIRLKLDDEGEYQDIGEYAEFSITPNIQKIEYFSRKHGQRRLVREVVSQSQAAFQLGINSMNARNLGIALGGEPEEIVLGHHRITFMEHGAIEADVQFEGTNNEGDQIDFEGRLQFSPEQAINLAQDEFTVLTVGGQVLANAAGNFGYWGIRGTDIPFSSPTPGGTD